MVDPSYGPVNGPYGFVDGGTVRSTVDMFIYSPQVAKADWMGEDKPVVEAFEELFIDSEGFSLVQHVRCVQLDENSGAVMKALLMVSMDIS